MRKVFLLLLTVSFTIGLSAQKIVNLSQEEIDACKTPSSVAYNYLVSIQQKNFTKMEFLMAPEWRSELSEHAMRKGYYTWDSYFVDYKKFSEKMIITDIYELNTDDYFGMYGETNKYQGLPAYSVTFYGINDDGYIFNGRIHEKYERARVLLIRLNGTWKVFTVK